ncbi:putative 7-deoxyloganetin glucosyltransferase [Helianthus anomalus]
MHGIRLKDIPPFIRYINPGDEYMVQFFCSQFERAKSVSAIFFNSFDELDCDILDTISLKFAPCYGIGPLHLIENTIVDKGVASFKSNLWKEESECVKWLDTKESSSVVYVNFGSITVMTSQQLAEFGWGLAKSNYSFLWIIRPDLVIDEAAVLPPELLAEINSMGRNDSIRKGMG